MDKTYVFNSEPSNSGGRLDVTALLPNLLGSNNSFDPNLLFALNNGYRNQDMWGGAGCWWIWILLLFGWGRNGFGGYGGDYSHGLPYALNGDAGREMLMNAIQGNGNAISQLATTLNCDVNSIKDNLFNIQSLIQGVGNQVGMSGQQIINSIQSVGCQIGSQIASCCCDVKSAIERQGYEGRIETIKQTDDIKTDASVKYSALSAQLAAQTQMINDKFCDLEKRELQNKIDSLSAEKTALETSALLQQQSQNLINQLRPCPVPAYLTCSPYTSINFPYGCYPYNNGCNGCGCNTGFGI